MTDEFSHQFMGLYTPTDVDGNPNRTSTTSPTMTSPTVVPRREGYVKAAYQEADGILGLARSLMGQDATVFAARTTGSRRNGTR